MGVTQEVHVTRSCDACTKTVEFVQGKVTPECLRASVGWFIICQEHLVGDPSQGQPNLVPVQKLCCSKTCALQVLHKDMCELPRPTFNQTEITEPLDMSKLN